MNIAFLQRSFSKNTREAAKITTLNLAKELVKRGDNAVVITEGGYLYEEKLPKFEKIDGISVFRPYSFFQPRRKIKLAQIISYFIAPALGVKYVQDILKIKFDVIHSSSAAPAMVLMGWFGKLFSIKSKLIHTIKSESFYGFKFPELLNLADKIIVPLQLIKNKLMKQGVSSKKITIIRSSIDTEKYIPLNKEKMKEKYGFKNKKVILYFGWFNENKGVDDLIDAVPLLAEKENVEVLLVHPDRMSKKYKRKVEELGKYRKNVKIFVKSLNVKEMLNAVDVLALPYKNLKATEANPSCLLEGMACETPIVTTALPELKEIVTENKDVLMAKPGNPKSIAENILKLLNDKELQKRLTEHAYKKVKNFDIKKIAKEHFKVYDELMKK